MLSFILVSEKLCYVASIAWTSYMEFRNYSMLSTHCAPKLANRQQAREQKGNQIVWPNLEMSPEPWVNDIKILMN